MNRYKHLYDLYLLKNLFIQFLFWLGFFTVLFLLSIFLEKIEIFLEQNTPANHVARYLIHQIPYWMWKASPLAFLGAALTVLDQSNRAGELIALESIGISPMRIFMPIFGVALLLCLAGEAGLESQSPILFRNSRMFLKTKIEHRQLKHLAPLENFVAKGSKERYYVFGHFNPADSSFEDFWLEQWKDKDKMLQIFAKRGHYAAKENIWHLNEVAKRTYFPKEELQILETFQLALDDDRPATLLPTIWRLEEMTMPELKLTAELNRERGIAQRSILVEYHHRLSWPLSFIVLAIASITVLNLFPKKMFRGKLLLFGMTLVIGLAYWFLVNLSKTLAAHGILSAVWSAWSPHLGIIGALLATRHIVPLFK